MLKIVATLLRGRAAEAGEALADAQALPLLRQQMREAAAAHEAARRAVALAMAGAERERAGAARLAAQAADLEARALAALGQGREDLAAEAAGALAQLEAEAAASARALAVLDAETARLRGRLGDAEARLRALGRGRRVAAAVEATQRLERRLPPAGPGPLAEAEATLARLEERQATHEAVREALAELSAATGAEAVADRLAAAGCGPALRPDAASVLARLRARAAGAAGAPA